jgi:hypothetical protein
MPSVITISRSRLYPCVARRGPAWVWYYEAIGLDGNRYDNRSIVELRRVLKRRYPNASIIEPWKS